MGVKFLCTAAWATTPLPRCFPSCLSCTKCLACCGCPFTLSACLLSPLRPAEEDCEGGVARVAAGEQAEAHLDAQVSGECCADGANRTAYAGASAALPSGGRRSRVVTCGRTPALL